MPSIIIITGIVPSLLLFYLTFAPINVFYLIMSTETETNTNIPVISIVGRPNVGKSSLFNRILGKRIAVVDDVAGVTRDRNYMKAAWSDAEFTLVDTGGLIPNLARRYRRPSTSRWTSRCGRARPSCSSWRWGRA